METYLMQILKQVQLYQSRGQYNNDVTRYKELTDPNPNQNEWELVEQRPHFLNPKSVW